MPVLTAIDVLGIQRYVFASNRLRDAVSASWLVHWATASDGALAESGGDLFQASGGSAILRFAEETRAREFAGKYTRRLYDQAPGLEVAVAHRAYAPDELASAIEGVQVNLAVAKFERAPSAPQLGLSVTAPCRISGLPASGLDPQDPTVSLSRLVLRWRDRSVQEQATGRWNAFFAGTAGWAFASEIDDMGRTRGETSLVGVVHLDGNGVGQQITSWLRRCVDAGRSDDAVRSNLTEWSSVLGHLGERSLRSVVARVTRAVQEDDNEPRLLGAVADLVFGLRRSGENVLLPIRPVLLGGDDLTFLCDGRIALDLAETALDAFNAEVPHLGHVTACAGVAIVPAHTPFDRAYALAETLCGNAKRRRQEKNDGGSWVDWHIGAPRPGEGVGDLRARAYSHPLSGTSLELTCRPYPLGTHADDPGTWRWLSQSVLGTRPGSFRGEQWRQHHNKLKELASALREGKDGVRRTREGWTAAAGLQWPDGLDQKNGFIDGLRTPLLDAVELLDIHLPLTGEADAR